MLKRLAIESNGYVYAYHSSSGDIQSIKFMGMTEESYRKAKGSFNVLCYVKNNGCYTQACNEIKEDYEVGKTHGKSQMGISDNKSIEDSMKCAKNFYENVKGVSPTLKDLESALYFVDLKTGKGIKLKVEDIASYVYCIEDEFEEKTISIKDNIEGTVVDFGRLLSESIISNNEEISLRAELKRYRNTSRYCRFCISENSECSLTSLFSGVILSLISDMGVLKDLLKRDTDVVYVPNEHAYWF
mgnify:CR=1 FL=1